MVVSCGHPPNSVRELSPTYLGALLSSAPRILREAVPNKLSQVKQQFVSMISQHLISWLHLSSISLFFPKLLFSLSLAADQPSFCTQLGGQLAGETTPLH